MTKKKYLRQLKWQLRGMPKDEIRDTLDYYDELIREHMDEGMSEEEAVARLGEPKEIAKVTRDETDDKKKKRRVRPGWQIALIWIGSVIWIPLLIVALVLTFVFYIVLWVMVLVLAVVDLALLISALACIAGIVLAIRYGAFQMIPLFVGGVLLTAGLAVLLFFGTLAAAKGVVKLGGSIIRGIGKAFTKEG